MAFRWRWLLISLTLILSGEPLFAAGTKEQRAYAAAVAAFRDEMWSSAETELAQFIQKYPKSTNAPEAVLLQAQAEFKQGKLAQAIALLDARKAGAGHLADQYVYWIGEAQFQNVDLTNAGETFIALARDFPESSLRLRAVVEAAAARAELAATHAGPGDWPEVGALLQETNGVFQRAAQLDPANELVTRGRLLLAQAALAQKDFGGAAATLASVNPQALNRNWAGNWRIWFIRSSWQWATLMRRWRPPPICSKLRGWEMTCPCAEKAWRCTQVCWNKSGQKPKLWMHTRKI